MHFLSREAIPKLIAEIRRLRSAHYNIFGALNKPVIYDPSADDKYSDLEIGDSYIAGYYDDSNT
jgi:hypothetical protein